MVEFSPIIVEMLKASFEGFFLSNIIHVKSHLVFFVGETT
jgi:hypothetical protein